MAKRIFSIATLVISVLVLLLCLGALAGTWVANRAANTAAVSLLAGIDRTAGAVRQGVGRVDAGVTRAADLVDSVEAATDQLGEKIADQGLVRTLLPEQKEQELATTVQGVADAFAGVREVLGASIGLYQAVDSMPFVSLPMPDQARLEEAGETVDQLTGKVERLRAETTAVRSGVAGKVDRLSAAAAAVNGDLEQLVRGLALVDAELAAVQARAAQLQTIVPTLFDRLLPGDTAPGLGSL